MLAQVKGNHLEIQQQQLLTQGSVGQKLALSLSEDWEGLAVTAVFSAGSTSCDVLVSGREIDIPWELFKEPDHKLFLNLHGGSPDGHIVLRTNIACLGNIDKIQVTTICVIYKNVISSILIHHSCRCLISHLFW